MTTSVEADFARAVLDPARPVPAGVTTARGEPDRLRLAVYRNTVHVSLLEALVRAFPVSLMLVGDGFFRAMARAYVGRTKPETPVLLHYGASFPDFIARFPPAAGLPYLADLAHLEHARNQACHAADMAVAGPETLAAIAACDLARSRFRAHAATRLLSSDFPIGTIWMAHQSTPPRPVAASGGETVLVTRPAAEVLATIVPASDVPFMRALLGGATLAEAAGASHDPAFDPGRALIGLASRGALAATDPHQRT